MVLMFNVPDIGYKDKKTGQGKKLQHTNLYLLYEISSVHH